MVAVDKLEELFRDGTIDIEVLNQVLRHDATYWVRSINHTFE